MKRLISLLFIFAVLSHALIYSNELNQQKKDFVLAAVKDGLYYWDHKSDPFLIWNNGGNPPEIKKFLPVPYGLFLLTSYGVFFTEDGKEFETRNNGISYKVIKIYRNNEKSFTNEIDDLKDLKFDPENPSNLIACSKDSVYLSTNGGMAWLMIQSPVPYSSIKTAAVISSPDLRIYLGHSFKGLYTMTVGSGNRWKNISKGLFSFSKTYEEIADILVRKEGEKTVLYAANNFTPILYTWNDKLKSWNIYEKFQKDFDMMESLVLKEKYLYFVGCQGIMRYDLDHKNLAWDNLNLVKNDLEKKIGLTVNAVYGFDERGEEFNFSGLWIPSLPRERENYSTAARKNGLYVQAGALKNKARLQKLINMMERNGLNMLTIDMKDDWGYLRFKPLNSLVAGIAKVVNPLDLESFISLMKQKHIYLTARMVLFKDRVLFFDNNSKYAVKGKRTDGAPWQGIKTNKNGALKKIEEYWVDPYCEKVWEYNIAIAKELSERGFDEIQFDYVRFPTDGINIDDASYSYKEDGMDKESAIMSFLAYARENISVPISIDIYGANGFYRTGARTGQDVELFRKYVDVICPMFYPSHFSEDFLNREPFEKRPYRIYYYGALRNYYIGKKELVIRPYVQTFNLHGPYDRKYYGPKYIADEITGIQDSINLGCTFWNMGMKYSILNEACSNISIK